MLPVSKNMGFFTVFLLVTALMEPLEARPGNFKEFGTHPHENRCNIGDQNVIEVCQRCAKQTKSPIVYPMCCVNEDDVFNWCDKYINYGKQSKRSLLVSQ